MEYLIFQGHYQTQTGSQLQALTIGSLWAPVVTIYLLDLHVFFYTLISAVWGFLLGARDREIQSLEALHRLSEEFPSAFIKHLHVSNVYADRSSELSEKKINSACFSPFWNEIIQNLRDEDYITSFYEATQANANLLQVLFLLNMTLQQMTPKSPAHRDHHCPMIYL